MSKPKPGVIRRPARGLEVETRNTNGELVKTDLRAALDRAAAIINWMAPTLGKMCPPANGLADLNEHWLFMEQLERMEQAYGLVEKT